MGENKKNQQLVAIFLGLIEENTDLSRIQLAVIKLDMYLIMLAILWTDEHTKDI